MKTLLAFCISGMILLAGCGWISDLFNVDIPADLFVYIDVTTYGEKSASSTEASIEFNESGTLSLEGCPDLANYLDRIKEVSLDSLEITITGLQAGDVINAFTLEADDIGIICSKSNITNGTGIFVADVNVANFKAAAAQLQDLKDLTLTIYGSVNTATAFDVVMRFVAMVRAGA
jgi:hypothetical protein